jgi:cobalamin-dependent methionine synthase I
MIIIGERINSSNENIRKAIEGQNVSFIQKEAILQSEAGADYIDVNAGSFATKEVEYLSWLVETVQLATAKPLCIDSSNPNALIAGLKLHKGKAIVNSITAEKDKYNTVLPVLKEYDCSVVALPVNDSGIPITAEDRLSIAGKLLRDLEADGIDLTRVYIDPIILPISVNVNNGHVVLSTIELIKQRYPEVRTICGLSNISFGLPQRQLLNQVFIAMAIEKGLDVAILDPCDDRLMKNILVANALLGKDRFCMNYIRAFKKEKLRAER